MNKTIAILASGLAMAAFAEVEDAGVAECVRGPWMVRAGYAWRAAAKTDFSGSGSALSAGGLYENGHWNASSPDDWSASGFESERYANPSWDGHYLNSMSLVRSESAASGSDEHGAHGVNLAIGRDFWSWKNMRFTALLSFAGYWGVENNGRGGYSRYADQFAFLSGPYPEPGYPAPEAGLDTATFMGRDYLAGEAVQRTRLRSDLYQIGLGPQVTWTPFEGWCESLSWIDVYGNVEVLCNIIRSKLDAGASSATDTNCNVGVGGNVGIVGNITDWCGVYGQVGYEWVDKDEVSVGGIRAETDYSSLVLSAGLQFRF